MEWITSMGCNDKHKKPNCTVPVVARVTVTEIIIKTRITNKFNLKPIRNFGRLRE